MGFKGSVYKFLAVLNDISAIGKGRVGQRAYNRSILRMIRGLFK